MLMQRFGELQDVDPLRGAAEASIIRALRKQGPTRQRDLWYRSAGWRVGREVWQQLIDDLVQQRVVVRESTNRVDSFLLRIAPDKRRSERAKRKQLLALQEGQQ
jgi:hypothetical protein